MIDWIEQHWQQLLTIILGGGTAFGAKKAMDAQQNSRIKKLEDKMQTVQNDISQVKQELETNTILDKQLRAELKEHRESLDKRLDRIESGQSQIIQQQLDFYKEILRVASPK